MEGNGRACFLPPVRDQWIRSFLFRAPGSFSLHGDGPVSMGIYA